MKTTKIKFVFLLAISTFCTGAISANNVQSSLIFSNQPIDAKNPQNLQTDFKSGDFIYGLVRFQQTIMEMLDMEDPRAVEVMLSYDLNGERINTTTGRLSKALVGGSQISFEFVANPETVQSYTNPGFTFKKYPNPAACDGPIRVADDMRTWPAGNHKVNIVLHLNYKPVASGEFNISGTDFGMYKDIRDRLMINADKAMVADVKMPEAVKTDREREKQMIAALKSSNDWKTKRIDALEVLKIAIVYDWEIRRHQVTGAILHRYCIAAIAVKTNAGDCAYYRVTFQEDYIGGKFQPLKYDGAGNKMVLKCENI